MVFSGLQRLAAALAVSSSLSAAVQIDQNNATLPTAIHDMTHETINLNGFNMRALRLRYLPCRLTRSRLSPGHAEGGKVQGHNLSRQCI
jgi:hypothetical protein